ncbi:MAG: phosphoribosyl-AMP cyclohydrolase [Chloroflexota bacterium]|nr:phosphoribosyl-AMP cyclohydrolase [Chloroflexota bacterium]
MTTPEVPVRFGPDGLIPAVIQDATTKAVLMVGFMNAAALAATRESGRVHFWSRSRQQLWRKGETSGHEQFVRDIFVNCEQNSLLVTVDQVGAVCHDGYETCFYRRLEPGNHFAVMYERVFDPATVYGRATDGTPDLAGLSRAYFAAFAYLRDHDLSSESSTSARLRDPIVSFNRRIAEELRELAGVLDGSHRHRDFRSDLLLEGGQVLYWVTLAALRERVSWAELRPDRALATWSDEIAAGTAGRLLRAEAGRWAATGQRVLGPARYHAVLALVGQAVHAGEISPSELIETDLSNLRAKPYLHEFFTAAAGSADPAMDRA